jgi:hypothetical protein
VLTFWGEYVRKKIFVVLSVYKGCLDEVSAFRKRSQATARRNELCKDIGLTEKDRPDNAHYRSCRWNDEKEVHLHPVDLQ